MRGRRWSVGRLGDRTVNFLRIAIQKPECRLNVLSVVLAVWLFGCTAFQFYPRTSYGTQCPTAAVQTIVVAVKDCCGKEIGQVRRAPKPGEQAFVQCQCAEKKNAQHEASLPPKLEPFPSEVFHFDVPTRLPESLVTDSYSARFVTLSVPPLVRPPVLA